MSSKRIVLRAHEQWVDHYIEITREWFDAQGNTKADCDKSVNGFPRHNTRIAYIGGGRFHIIIDMEEGPTPEPADPQVIPLEIYRAYRGNNGSQTDFKHIDQKKQPQYYSAVRGFSQEFEWGLPRGNKV